MSKQRWFLNLRFCHSVLRCAIGRVFWHEGDRFFASARLCIACSTESAKSPSGGLSSACYESWAAANHTAHSVRCFTLGIRRSDRRLRRNMPTLKATKTCFRWRGGKYAEILGKLRVGGVDCGCSSARLAVIAIRQARGAGQSDSGPFYSLNAGIFSSAVHRCVGAEPEEPQKRSCLLTSHGASLCLTSSKSRRNAAHNFMRGVSCLVVVVLFPVFYLVPGRQSPAILRGGV